MWLKVWCVAVLTTNMQVLEHLGTVDRHGVTLQSSNSASIADGDLQLKTADGLQTHNATAGTAADDLYSQLVQLGLLRR